MFRYRAVRLPHTKVWYIERDPPFVAQGGWKETKFVSFRGVPMHCMSKEDAETYIKEECISLFGGDNGETGDWMQ